MDSRLLATILGYMDQRLLWICPMWKKQSKNVNVHFHSSKFQPQPDNHDKLLRDYINSHMESYYIAMIFHKKMM